MAVDPRSGRSRYLGQFRPRFSAIDRDRDLMWVVPVAVDELIAVVGRRFSGKSTVLNYLSERHNFDVYRLGNELREIAAESGIALEPRRSLQDFGDEFRAETRDGGRLARRMLRRVRRDHLASGTGDASRRVVLEGFRRPEELRVVLKAHPTAIWIIEADDKIRADRGKKNGVLQHELEQIGETLEIEISPNKRNFKKYIDHRDRVGVDPTETASPYSGRWGQATDRVLDLASSAEVVSSARAVRRIANNFEVVAKLFSEVDAALAELRRPGGSATHDPR